MSNNIIDTVTQAVNSLVSALKLPDESAKANDTLGSMNFPQFSRILPYKDYDSATGLFINNKTVGFMFEARPLPGADKSIVATLEHLLRSKLPRGVPVSFHLVSSKLVGNDIDYGLREFRWSGKQAKKFNAITQAYYLRAAETKFPLPPDLDLPLTLRNYRVYISCCVPRKKNSTTQIVEMENQIKILRASLGGAYIPTRSPLQLCPAPPPIFVRPGLAIGYWEPMAMTDVSRSPGCMVNLGGFSINLGKTGMGTARKDDKQVNGAFYHVHWYKYPLTYWLNIITSAGCLEGGDMDIAYLSEIDPTWVDSSLTTILNPEAILFANPIAQGACAADAMASAFHMPLDILFWCAGSQGSMYPFSGWVSNESSPLQSSLLVSERMAYKLHRQGQIMESIGKDKAVCYEYPSPIIPKERWRYQMVNMYPDSGQCHPVGRSVMRWEAGKNPPNTRKNYGYLMWRKRNCVFL